MDTNLDPFAQQENEEVEDILNNEQDINDEDEEERRQNQTTNGASLSERPCVLPDKEINEKIQSLNTKQREIFDIVFTWATRYVKSRNKRNSNSKS